MARQMGESVDVMIDRLWCILDGKGKGHIDANGLRKGLRKIDHPLKDADELLHHVMQAVDSNGDGIIQYQEFRDFVKQTERELRVLFDGIDRDRNGRLDKAEMRAAFARAGLVVPNSKLDEFFEEVDANHDGTISFEEWRDFLLFIPVDRPSLRAVLSYYSAAVTLTSEGDVQLGNETIQGLGTDLSSFLSCADPSPAKHDHCAKDPPRPKAAVVVAVVAVADLGHDFRNLFSSCGGSGPGQLVEIIPMESTDLLDSVAPEALTAILKSALTSLPDSGYFVAGGMAGVVSRTATAPLDRLKVYLIAQTGVTQEALQAAKQGAAIEATKKASRPLVEASKALWRAGGVRSLFAGNGLNVVKIVPESAIKFGSYEAAKRALAKIEGHGDPKQLNSLSKFLAGGLGGLVSQAFVYPVDTLKFRMQCETVEGGLRGNRLILATAGKMWSGNGVWAFYRGLPMGLVGVFPYAAIDLGTFEYLKRAITRRKARRLGCHEEDAAPSSFATAGIGALSGALGATIVYPINLLRTRLQAQGTAVHPATYTGIRDVMRTTVRREGVRGLFKGLTPNLLKVVPAVSISYVVYENSKRLLGLQ